MTLIGVRVSGGRLGVGWFRFETGQDKYSRFIFIQRFECTFVEDIVNPLEPTREVRFAVSAGANEISAEIIGASNFLDFRHNLVFRLLPSAVLDPAILEDTHLPRLFVPHLKHPRSPAAHRISSTVIEYL